MFNNVGEYLEAEARDLVRLAVKEYNEGHGISGMYNLFIGSRGWRVEYNDRGHHLSLVVDAVHELYAEDNASRADELFKKALEKLLSESGTISKYYAVCKVICKEIEKELFGTNSFTIDVDQTTKKFGEYVTASYDELCEDFKNVNAEFDDDFLEFQLYALEHFGVFIEAEQIDGNGQLGFLRKYIGGDIEFDELTEKDLRKMLCFYRVWLPDIYGIANVAMDRVKIALEKYSNGDSIVFKNLIMGSEEEDITCFPGAGHNYKFIVDAIHKIYSDDRECKANEIFENCIAELIKKANFAYEIKLLANIVMYEQEVEKSEKGSFKLDIEKLTEYFIENIRNNEEKYLDESIDFYVWLLKKPVAREKTLREKAVIEAEKAEERIKREVVSLRKYVGWDKEYDEMSELDLENLYKSFMSNLGVYKEKLPELEIKVDEAISKYRSGDKEQFINLLRGIGSGKIEFINGTGHAYRIIIDILHAIYSYDNSCGVDKYFEECLYDMAEGMKTIRDVEEMVDLMISELEKEKNQDASFEINSHEISLAMRENTVDNVDSYISQNSDFYEFRRLLRLRMIDKCGERII